MEFIQRGALIQKIKESVENGNSLAIGKLGFSEQFLLGYLPYKQKNPRHIQLKAYEAMLRYHCEVQFGVFPTNPSFLHEFAQFYEKHVKHPLTKTLFSGILQTNITQSTPAPCTDRLEDSRRGPTGLWMRVLQSRP